MDYKRTYKPKYKLNVFLSPILYGRLPIVAADDETKERLQKFYPNGMPKNVLVKLPRKTDPNNLPASISSRIGRKCTIYVSTAPYKLVSTYERNLGDVVQGITLTLHEIKDFDQS